MTQSTLIRLPNWLGDVVMAMPVIRALHDGSAHHITLLAQLQFKPFLERLTCFDDVIYLPPKGPSYYFKLRAIKHKKFDHHVLFTYSERTDVEAWLIGATHRHGITRSKKRPLLNCRFTIPHSLDAVRTHQTIIQEEFMRHQGFLADSNINLSPILLPLIHHYKTIALICGTENTPAKRWPIAHWVELINQITCKYPEYKLRLLGTPLDRVITDSIEHALDTTTQSNVTNVAGQTDLSGFIDELQRCALVIGNDTGGMHLANALGTPVIGIFGPTNPLRTGPIFDTPSHIIQAPNGKDSGGDDINLITSHAVLNAVAAVLN